MGLHEGPCLAVILNDRLDYFGQTVNIAARVQGLASSDAVFATAPVVEAAGAPELIARHGLVSHPRQANLRGIEDVLTVYELTPR